MAHERYDTIIIGGGSAGCVLANRLSEDPAHRVLVLEAGRPDSLWDLFIHMPAGLTVPLGNRFYDWQYQSDPEPHMGGRRVYHARGKVLGGSSSINGMIYVRGNALDYDRWAADPGMARWSYAHCLPYFRRAESRAGGDPRYRGADGPLHLEPGPCTNPLFQAFFGAVQQAGHELTDDYNGYRQEGFGPFDRNVRGGWRWSAARAYLHPVRRRPNLRTICRAFVTRIVLDGDRAVAVEYTHRRKNRRVEADRIVCCGGAINTPQLLQLSGIGDPETLKAAGVEPRHALPGVGGNLQDHLEVYVQHACTQPVSLVPAMKWYNKPWIGLQWLAAKVGPAATNHFEAGGFYRSNDDAEWPNVQLHFLPLAVRYDGSSPASAHGYQVHAGPVLSDAIGRLAIRSADPREKPGMVFNYLSTEKDRREWVETIRSVREILRQPAFAEFDAGELSPGPAVQTDAEILEWVARDAETALHPCGTCRMGVGEDAVVDPDTFAVRGLRGLHVVDASLIPYVTNGNIYAPVMMMAEKAADALRGAEPLPPSDAPYYRHGAD